MGDVDELGHITVTGSYVISGSNNIIESIDTPNIKILVANNNKINYMINYIL